MLRSVILRAMKGNVSSLGSPFKGVCLGTMDFSLSRRVDLQGCALRIGLVPAPGFVMNAAHPLSYSPNASHYNEGIDILLLSLLSKQLNFSMIFKPVELYGWLVVENFLWNKEIDLAIGMFTADIRSYLTFQPSETYWTNEMSWFVPCGAAAPAWLSVAFVFSPPLWLAVALSVAAAALAFAGLGACRPPGEPPLAALHALQVLLWGSAARVPLGSLRRCVLLAWVLGCLVLNAAYQSALVSVLTSPHALPAIGDVDGLLRSDLHFGLLEPTRVLLADFHDPRYEQVVRRSSACASLQACLEGVALARDAAVPMTASQAAFRAGGRLLPLLSRVPEPVLTARNVLLLARASPIAPAVDFVVQGAVSGGLLVKRWADLAPVPVPPAPSGPVALRAADLQGAAALWLLGLLVSAAAFVAELCFWRFVTGIRLLLPVDTA